jgi:UDP-N-acetylglucosamine 2-epimerase (non-hydrolysing)
MKILICFGTRPEAIKIAPLYFELKKRNFNVKICITAQHREMLDQVLTFFNIVPDYDLNLMQKGQSLNELSSRIFFNIDKVLNDEMPDLVIVHGDTTTSCIVAMACFHKQIKLAHVEAGLRTNNIKSPFPEELNRQITSKIADYHFAPTTFALNNLLNEKINNDNVIVTGNTVIDALFLALKEIEKNPKLIKEDLVKLFEDECDFILSTLHRRENLGDGFENICKALNEIAKDNVKILIPVHLNPKVKEVVNRVLGTNKNIILLEPLDYPNFVYALSKSKIIITDSGGIQEEAPSLGKPVLVVRDTTERQEAVQFGTVKLVGTKTNVIIEECVKLLNDEQEYLKMSRLHNPYGDGTASKKIVDYILKQFN